MYSEQAKALLCQVRFYNILNLSFTPSSLSLVLPYEYSLPKLCFHQSWMVHGKSLIAIT